MDHRSFISKRPIEERDGVLYFHKPPADIAPSRDQNPLDKRTWSYWRMENYRFLKEEMSSIYKNAILGDVGAGQSDFVELTGVFNLCAVDFYPYPGIHVVCNLEDSLPFDDKSADVVLLINVLEHMREP